MKSAYMHIPFCKNICSYCDFCKFYYNENIVLKYIESLKKEIKERYRNEILDTIYIGGGTPSSLDLNILEDLLQFISNTIKVSDKLEYTIECNVNDLTKEKLELFKKHNINRLSIGVESFNKDNLTFLERIQTKDEIINNIKLAKMYFNNINIDLIYAIPGETIDILKEDLELFLELDIPHISCYSLIIEDHTKLGIKDTDYIDEDLDYEMYKLIENTLEKNNYNHYEISNYAKTGFESKHNMCYWKNHRYYGFGLSSSGYIDNIRYTNTKNMNKYLNGEYIAEKEYITRKLNASNYAILGLRTSNGVNKKEFENEIKEPFNKVFDTSDLIETKDSFYLPREKWYIENSILTKFI